MGLRRGYGMAHHLLPLVFVVACVLIHEYEPVDAWLKLRADFYKKSCPQAHYVVAKVVKEAIAKEPRMGASLLRLHFHDCFVQGCDASLLLDDPNGEQTAPPNQNSIRGLNVIDDIKEALEDACPGIVSCADILALAAEVSVVVLGGQKWPVLLGRRDSTTFASSSVVVQSLVAPTENLTSIIQKFAVVGLSPTDAVVLSGAHTIGRARCVTFQDRLYNFNNTGKPDPTMNPKLLATLRSICPQANGNGNALTNLDQGSGDRFDNKYFLGLKNNYGVLQSDQELYSTPGATAIASLVHKYSSSQSNFFNAFGISMIKMGNNKPLLGSNGQVRRKCGKVNS